MQYRFFKNAIEYLKYRFIQFVLHCNLETKKYKYTVSWYSSAKIFAIYVEN